MFNSENKKGGINNKEERLSSITNIYHVQERENYSSPFKEFLI